MLKLTTFIPESFKILLVSVLIQSSTLSLRKKGLEFEIYNYLNDSNCYVSPVRFNGNEVSDDKKESLSLSVGLKSSIARYLITCAKPTIENNEENREKIKGELESAIRKFKLDLDDIFRNKFNI